LRRANQLLAAGNYAEASSAYEQLARAAEARGGPRAPFFYLQAGRAAVLAGHVAGGIEQLERGIGLFAMRAQPFKAATLGMRIVHELDARGLKQEAARVNDYLKELIPDFETAPAVPTPPTRPALPAHCPACGAPLRPDEVDWVDETAALCEYCGGPVHGG
jgi:hypothetical protein